MEALEAALADDGETDRNPRDAAAVPERLCVATRQVRPVGGLIRYVIGPDGAVVPDIKRRLPGRGAWVTARRRALEEAVRKRLFNRAFKAEVKISAGFVDEVDRLLEQSALNALSIAQKAGVVIQGFSRVEAALGAAQPAVVALIRAHDGGEDGGRKLAAALCRRANGSPWGGGEEKIVEAFTSAQLDLALGRLNVVHAALLAGQASEAFLVRWRFLEDFRADEPV